VRQRGRQLQYHGQPRLLTRRRFSPSAARSLSAFRHTLVRTHGSLGNTSLRAGTASALQSGMRPAPGNVGGTGVVVHREDRATGVVLYFRVPWFERSVPISRPSTTAQVYSRIVR